MAKYCSSCGTQLQEVNAFCPSCGAAVLTSQSQQQTPAGTGAPDTVLKVSGKTLKTDTILILISIILIALSVFVPCYKISWRTEIYGYNPVSWKTLLSTIFSGYGSTFPAFLAFIVPVIMLLMFVLKRRLTFLADKHSLAAAGLCVLGIIFSIVFMFATSTALSMRRAFVRSAPTFLIMLLLYLAGIGIEIYSIKAAKTN